MTDSDQAMHLLLTFEKYSAAMSTTVRTLTLSIAELDKVCESITTAVLSLPAPQGDGQPVSYKLVAKSIQGDTQKILSDILGMKRVLLGSVRALHEDSSVALKFFTDAKNIDGCPSFHEAKIALIANMSVLNLLELNLSASIDR